MIGNDLACSNEPDGRNLREDLALVGDAGAENVVERGDAIGGDEQEPVPKIVKVSDLPLSVRLSVAETALKKRRSQGQQISS